MFGCFLAVSENCGGRELNATASIYVGGIVGGHCDHWGIGRVIVACRTSCEGVCEADVMSEQSQAVGIVPAEL
jgi:hypothetical protein